MAVVISGADYRAAPPTPVLNDRAHRRQWPAGSNAPGASTAKHTHTPTQSRINQLIIGKRYSWRRPWLPPSLPPSLPPTTPEREGGRERRLITGGSRRHDSQFQRCIITTCNARVSAHRVKSISDHPPSHLPPPTSHHLPAEKCPQQSSRRY